jgi:hypothetical protein
MTIRKSARHLPILNQVCASTDLPLPDYSTGRRDRHAAKVHPEAAVMQIEPDAQS